MVATEKELEMELKEERDKNKKLQDELVSI